MMRGNKMRHMFSLRSMSSSESSEEELLEKKALSERPTLSLWYGGDRDEHREVRELCDGVPGLRKGYCAAMKSGWLQTGILGLRMTSFWGVGAKKTYVEQFDLPDGARCALTWWRKERRSQHVAVVVPGLGNSSQTGFVRNLVRKLDEKGFDACAVDFRGSGISESTNDVIKNSHTLHDWIDMDAVIDRLTRSNNAPRNDDDADGENKEEDSVPPTFVYLVGQSMGGCCVLSHLGKRKCQRVKAAVAVSPLVETSSPTGLANFLLAQIIKSTFFLSGTLLRYVFALRGRANILRILLARSIEEIEQNSVCPVFGYESPEAYHTMNSPSPTLHHIQRPTLIIHSEDDPLVPPYSQVHVSFLVSLKTKNHSRFARTRTSPSPRPSTAAT